MLSDPETDVVERRVCVIEADPLPELKPGRAWINHVHAVKDQEKFIYAGPAMALTTTATFGPVAPARRRGGHLAWRRLCRGVRARVRSSRHRPPANAARPQRRRAAWPRANTTSWTARYA